MAISCVTAGTGGGPGDDGRGGPPGSRAAASVTPGRSHALVLREAGTLRRHSLLQGPVHQPLAACHAGLHSSDSRFTTSSPEVGSC